MIIRKFIHTAVIVAALSPYFCGGAGASELTWYKPEFPPLSIVNGPDAGKGYSDKLERYLMESLTEYDHKVLVSPFKRTVRDLKQGLQGCSVTLLKTQEREKFIVFTKPARLLLPNSLIVRKSDADSFNDYMDNDGKISVEKVIKAGKVRIGFSNGRSYTAPLDTLLKANAGVPNLIERLGSEGPKGLLSMLDKGHIDALFAQPVEAQFHGRIAGLRDKIVALPIAEINDYTVGYIGCADTAWGRKAVARINDLLTDAVKQPEFRTFYEEFLDRPSRERYRKIYDAYFGLQ